MIKNKKVIPCIFYLYLHSKLYDMLPRELSLKDVKKSLFQWKIPRKLRPLIVKELEMLGLIVSRGRYTVEINKPQFNEENCNNYYKELNLF